MTDPPCSLKCWNSKTDAHLKECPRGKAQQAFTDEAVPMRPNKKVCSDCRELFYPDSPEFVRCSECAPGAEHHAECMIHDTLESKTWFCHKACPVKLPSADEAGGRA